MAPARKLGQDLLYKGGKGGRKRGEEKGGERNEKRIPQSLAFGNTKPESP